jgi:response regulator NasT
MSAVIKIVGQKNAFCDGLRSALGAAGYQVLLAASDMGVAAASTLPVPALTVLVLLASGAVSQLGAPMPALNSPFIVVADEYNEAAGRTAADMGALAYLVRPTEPRACVPTIAAALGRVEEIRQLREKEANLSIALQQNRATSIAVGILMERLRVDRNRAMDTLRDSARKRRCKLVELAEELLGALERINGIG